MQERCFGVRSVYFVAPHIASACAAEEGIQLAVHVRFVGRGSSHAADRTSVAMLNHLRVVKARAWKVSTLYFGVFAVGDLGQENRSVSTRVKLLFMRRFNRFVLTRAGQILCWKRVFSSVLWLEKCPFDFASREVHFGSYLLLSILVWVV